MFIDENLEHTGSISGGCLEKDLIQKTWWNLREGTPLITYDTRIEDESSSTELPTGPFNTGCSGLVHVLLEEIKNDDAYNPITVMQWVFDTQTPAVIATVYRNNGLTNIQIGERAILQNPDDPISSNIKNPALLNAIQKSMLDTLHTGHTGCHQFSTANASADVLIEVLNPPRSLYLFGAGDDAKPVVTQARQLGWQTCLIDHRTHLANSNRFPDADIILPLKDVQALPMRPPAPDSAAVIMTHNIARDAELIPALLQYKLFYIGLLGPAARLQRLKNYWHRQNIKITVKQMEQLHAPIGLDLGADNAAEIAIAVIAEIIATSNQRCGGMLKQQNQPLHEPAKHYQHTL